MRIPRRNLDPYLYPPRVHRTGDSALNPHMSIEVPPAWGPERQNMYSIEEWEQDVHAWYMTTRTADDRKGPLLMSQLTGVAKASLDTWISDPKSRVRRLRRIKEGNRAHRAVTHEERLERKREEKDIEYILEDEYIQKGRLPRTRGKGTAKGEEQYGSPASQPSRRTAEAQVGGEDEEAPDEQPDAPPVSPTTPVSEQPTAEGVQARATA